MSKLIIYCSKQAQYLIGLNSNDFIYFNLKIFVNYLLFIYYLLLIIYVFIHNYQYLVLIVANAKYIINKRNN